MGETFFNWFNIETGEGLRARIYEQYTGLRGQARIGLVDAQGRVHHFDVGEVQVIGTSRQIQIGEEVIHAYYLN